MLLSYSGYLRFYNKKDTYDNFEDFVRRCVGRDLLPIEVFDVKYLYRSDRFCYGYRLEV